MGKLQGSDDWNTPPDVLEHVRRMGKIALDPCSNALSTVQAEQELMLGGLSHPWCCEGLVFCNPPFSQLEAWAAKAATEAAFGAEIIMLVPAHRVEQKCWQQYLFRANMICFPQGRVRYWSGEERGGSPQFPSALVYFGKRVEDFYHSFMDFGKMVTPW